MPRQKLTIPDDRPLTVKFDFGPEGKQEISRYGSGVEYFHLLNDDQNCIYLKPEVQKALLASGAQAGDYVEFTKLCRGHATYYTARVLRDAQEPAPLSPQHSQATSTVPAPPTMTALAWPKAADVHPLGQQVAGFLKAVMDGFNEGQRYLNEKNYGYRFDNNSVTSTMITLLIDARNKGSR